MELIPSIEEKYYIEYEEKTIRKQLKKNGATFSDNNFLIQCSLYATITGKIEMHNLGYILTIKSSMPELFKLFGVLWLIGTGTITFLSTYQMLSEWMFSWIPVISLIFLISGLIFIFFLYTSYILQDILSIKKSLCIKNSMKYQDCTINT